MKSEGAVLVELSIDPKVASRWDTRDACRGHDQQEGPAPQIMRDGKMMEDYYVTNPLIFDDPSQFRVERVMKLQHNFQFVQAQGSSTQTHTCSWS